MPAPPDLDDPRYVIDQLLGTGGMADVWRAWDTRLRAWRAIKVLKPELARRADTLARFETEARAMARLQHRNVVPVHDVHTDGSVPFLVMDWLSRGSLAGLMQRHGPLPPRAASGFVADVLDALEAAHRAGVVHRDVKPHNVLFDAQGAARLSDFGVARLDDEASFTRTGTAVGTLAYMAPEQRTDGHAVDGRADVYAAGAMLAALLTGRDPHDLHVDQVRSRLLADVPPPIRAVIERATAFDRAERFPSAAEMACALRDAAAGLPQEPAIELPEPEEPEAPASGDATWHSDPGDALVSSLTAETASQPEPPPDARPAAPRGAALPLLGAGAVVVAAIVAWRLAAWSSAPAPIEPPPPTTIELAERLGDIHTRKLLSLGGDGRFTYLEGGRIWSWTPGSAPEPWPFEGVEDYEPAHEGGVAVASWGDEHAIVTPAGDRRPIRGDWDGCVVGGERLACVSGDDVAIIEGDGVPVLLPAADGPVQTLAWAEGGKRLAVMRGSQDERDFVTTVAVYEPGGQLLGQVVTDFSQTLAWDGGDAIWTAVSHRTGTATRIAVGERVIAEQVPLGELGGRTQLVGVSGDRLVVRVFTRIDQDVLRLEDGGWVLWTVEDAIGGTVHADHGLLTSTVDDPDGIAGVALADGTPLLPGAQQPAAAGSIVMAWRHDAEAGSCRLVAVGPEDPERELLRTTDVALPWPCPVVRCDRAGDACLLARAGHLELVQPRTGAVRAIPLQAPDEGWRTYDLSPDGARIALTYDEAVGWYALDGTRLDRWPAPPGNWDVGIAADGAAHLLASVGGGYRLARVSEDGITWLPQLDGLGFPLVDDPAGELVGASRARSQSELWTLNVPERTASPAR